MCFKLLFTSFTTLINRFHIATSHFRTISLSLSSISHLPIFSFLFASLSVSDPCKPQCFDSSTPSLIYTNIYIHRDRERSEMEDYLLHFLDFVKKPAIIDTFVDILLCAVPIWVAVMIGLVIGWSWRPRWAGLVFLGLRPKLRFVWTFPPGFGARRLWLAFTALSAFSVASRLWSNFRLRKRKASAASLVADSAQSSTDSVEFMEGNGGGIRLLSSETSRKDHNLVTENDLEHLLHLLDGKGGETAWQNLMERSTSNMAYQAWRHEPEIGPVIYRSKTVFEDATPEMVRDFFWDDEFRPKWDPMLAYFKMLDECPHTGTTIVHWIKKFPFFCSDREYIIGRRIWEAGKTYYCVTKTVPYPALPRRDKPRRVEMYFSSWVIKPVQSRKGDGQLTACEVSLAHYEDMGIPKDVAKLGVRHGMWGTVKKLHGGFRAYQVARKSEVPVFRSALVARITTKISFEGTADSSETVTGEEERRVDLDVERHGDEGGIDLKWLVIGSYRWDSGVCLWISYGSDRKSLVIWSRP